MARWVLPCSEPKDLSSDPRGGRGALAERLSSDLHTCAVATTEVSGELIKLTSRCLRSGWFLEDGVGNKRKNVSIGSAPILMAAGRRWACGHWPPSVGHLALESCSWPRVSVRLLPRRREVRALIFSSSPVHGLGSVLEVGGSAQLAVGNAHHLMSIQTGKSGTCFLNSCILVNLVFRLCRTKAWPCQL